MGVFAYLCPYTGTYSTCPPYLIFTEAESRRSRGGVGSASIITFSQSPSLTSLPQRTSQSSTQKENIKMSQSIASYGLCELRHSTPRPAVTGSYHLAIVERMLSNASFLFFPQRSRHMNSSRCPANWSLRHPLMRLMFILTRFQYDSIWLVWTPVAGSLKCSEWLTVLCSRTCGKSHRCR